MKANKLFALVMALLVIALVAGCNSTSKITNPQPPDSQSGLVNVPSDSLNQRGTPQQTATAVGVFNSFPTEWKFPFVGSSKITVGYNGAVCGGGYDQYHTGNNRYAIDWSRLSGDADAGDPLLAPASGWYGGPGWDPDGYGHYVRIDAGNGYSYIIAHMQSIALNYCGWVNRGQYIGALGCSGNCSGAHIHFVVYKNGVSVPQTGISGQWNLQNCSTYSANW